ncbi:hypothetical protein ACLOJK_034228, partial [Asimina triloba]
WLRTSDQSRVSTGEDVVPESDGNNGFLQKINWFSNSFWGSATVAHGDQPIFALGHRSMARKKGRRRTTVNSVRLFAIVVAGAAAFTVTVLWPCFSLAWIGRSHCRRKARRRQPWPWTLKRVMEHRIWCFGSAPSKKANPSFTNRGTADPDDTTVGVSDTSSA